MAEAPSENVEVSSGNMDKVVCSEKNADDRGSVDTKEPVSVSVPWRKSINIGDNKKIRDKLVEEMTSYKPLQCLFPSTVQFPHVNILLLGAVGAGKSSTYNTIVSIFMNKIFRPASSGYCDHSLTTKVTKYSVMSNKKQTLNFKFWDMRGLEEKHFMTTENMKYLLEGNVPDKYPLDPSGEVNIDSPGFKRMPRVFETIHCVAVVIDSSIVQTLDGSTDSIRNIRELQTVMNGLDVPLVGVLTKIDQLCQDTNRDVTNALNSRKVGECVHEVSDVLGLPKHSIYPIKNYEIETELDTSVDIVALLTLKGILDHCDAFLVNRYKNIVDNASVAAAIDEETAKLRETNENLRTEARTLEEQLVSIDIDLEKLSKESNAPNRHGVSKQSNREDLLGQIKRLDDQRSDLEKEIKMLNEALDKLKVSEETCTLDAGPVQVEGFTITVQIYSKRNELLTGIEDEFTSQLTTRLKLLDMDVVFRHTANIEDIAKENPLLVLCPAASRLGTDVDDALRGLNLNKRTTLLVFHHKEMGALPKESSGRILTGEHLNQLWGIFDMAYVTETGFYECGMNKSSLDKIVTFIQNFSLTK